MDQGKDHDMKKKKEKKDIHVDEEKTESTNNAIDLTIGELNELLGSPAYISLDASADIEVEAKLELMRLFQELETAFALGEKLRQKFLDELAEKNPDGSRKLKPPEVDGKTYPNAPKHKWVCVFSDDNQSIFNERLERLFNQPAKIRMEKVMLKSSDYPKNLLSVKEMRTLSRIIKFVK